MPRGRWGRLVLLDVKDIVICGHSHCGAMAALYQPAIPGTPHVTRWLELARPAMVHDPEAPDALRRTEMRSLVVQLERLLSYPMVKERVEAGTLALHAWYYVIEEGSVLELDLEAGEFRPLNG